jgi:hypothetical protein
LEDKLGQATHEQANLLLKLYELRREPRLREARAWFTANFDAKTLEDVNKKCPPGSEGNVNMRMVVSYWEMAAGLVNRGLIDDELFFENAGEAWFVWERLRELAPAMRAAFKNPHAWEQLEALAKRLEEWQERRAPGHTAALRQRLNPERTATAPR